MSTVQQIQAQKAVFIQAYLTHKITKSQYDTAIANSDRQLAALQQPKPSAPAAPLPPVGLANQLTASMQNQPAPNMSPSEAINRGVAGRNTDVFVNTGVGGVTPVINTQEKANVATVVAALPIAPEVVVSSVVIGEAANVGINSAVKSIETGKAQVVLPTPQEVLQVAAESSVLGVVGFGVAGKVAEVAPRLAGEAAKPVVKAATNIGINTSISAGASAVISGGNPKAIAEGAVFGAALGAGGEVFGVAAGKVKSTETISRINDVVVGSKFKEITGVREVSTQVTSGKTTEVFKLTEPEIREVRLRGKDARYFRENNLGTLREPTVDLAGVEKVYTSDMINGGRKLEAIPTLKQVESTRNAEPILAAVNKEGTYKLASAKTGNKLLEKFNAQEITLFLSLLLAKVMTAEARVFGVLNVV